MGEQLVLTQWVPVGQRRRPKAPKRLHNYLKICAVMRMSSSYEDRVMGGSGRLENTVDILP